MGRTWKRLFGPAQISNAAATKYTVPALTKAVIRHIHIVNPGAAITFTASIGADAAGTRIFDALPIAGNWTEQRFGLWVMETTEILQAYGSVNNQLVLSLFGEENIL